MSVFKVGNVMDGCGIIDGDNTEFLTRWNERGRKLCVPMTGGIALTHRCNLKCIHCYAGPEVVPSERDVPTTRWLELIDEMVDAGCLFLLITGGDPLVHSGFKQIYRHAKESGMLVTVFTNGLLIDQEILDIFTELPPHVVEISIYGARAEMHDGITGVPGSFVRLLKVVDQLLARGIRLRLKSILMNPNLAEFAEIRVLVEEKYGVEFRMDAAIIPRLDGDMMPLELRVAPKDAVQQEMASPKQRKKWAEVQAQCKLLEPSPRLYNCGAGVIGFHIDANGDLLPCLMTTNIKYNLLERAFADGWKYITKAMREILVDKSVECASCENRVICGWCPSYALLENGDANSKPQYLCDLGKYRREMLVKI